MSTNYSEAAKSYATSWYEQGSVNCGIAAAAFDAGVASVTPYRQPERVLTADEVRALPWESEVAVRDAQGEIYGSNSSVIGPEYEPYTLVYDPSWAPAPVRLTPDDPRLKVGALVELVETHGRNGEENKYTRFVDEFSGWTARLVRDRIEGGQPVFLLAEAPDPDAERLSAVVTWLGNHGVTTSDSRDLLSLLDSVTKRAD